MAMSQTASESKRLYLHQKLVDTTELERVYYNPLPTQKLVYPCIVYNDADEITRYADDGMYTRLLMWNVTIISKNAVEASNLQDKILFGLDYARKATTFIQDNLYHKVLSITL